MKRVARDKIRVVKKKSERERRKRKTDKERERGWREEERESDRGGREEERERERVRESVGKERGEKNRKCNLIKYVMFERRFSSIGIYKQFYKQNAF